MSGEGSESPENARASGETYPFGAAHERLLATPPNAELARRPCVNAYKLTIQVHTNGYFSVFKVDCSKPSVR